MKVAQSCLTLCSPTDHKVHGILQARILEWVVFPFSEGIFPNQGLNPHLPHCRQILYQLSHKGGPGGSKKWSKTRILTGLLDPHERMNLTHSSKEAKKESNFRILGLCSSLDINFF